MKKKITVNILSILIILVFALVHRNVTVTAPRYNHNANQSSQSDTESDVKLFRDRVIVQLKNNTSTRSKTPNLGVRYKKARLVNPSKRRRNRNRFSTEDISSTQNNTFVLELETTGEDAVLQAVNTLKENPDVENAEPDYLYKLSKLPDDPKYTLQYGLGKILAPTAWNLSIGNTITVGVIDSGIEYAHPDLQPNFWRNPAESAVPNGIDTDNNGYIDDIYGYDFVKRVGGYPTDEDGHGTHVAGIIGAKGNNGIGICGVNWNVRLVALKIAYDDGYLSVDAAIEALAYAKNNGIMITNNSYGGAQYSKIFRDAIQKYGGIFVAAAGNDGKNTDTYKNYPSGFDCDNIISVASTDDNDQLSYFSNYGKNSVDIAAPGSSIYGTYRGQKYAYLSGTSMAAPFVAGTAALISSQHPDYTTDQIKKAILLGADPLSNLSGKMQTSGRLNTFYSLSPRSSPPYAIIAASDDLNYGTVSGEGVFNTNQTATVKAIPKQGHRFVRWLEGRAEVSKNSIYTFPVTKERMLKAEFAKIGKPEITAASSGYDRISVKWGSITGAKDYEVYRATASAGPYKKITTITAKSNTNTKLATNKKYFFKVRVRSLAGNVSTFGAYSSVKNAKPVPAKPTKLAAIRVSASKTKLKWGAVPGTTRFTVYRAATKSGKYKKILETTKRSYTIKQNKGKKYYKVRAYRKVAKNKVYGPYSAAILAQQ